MVPTERWFVVLGVALGLYGSVVAGAGGAGHLAATVRGWFRRAVVARAASVNRWARLRLHLPQSVNVHGVTAHGTLSASGHLSAEGTVGFAGWPGEGTTAEQTAALVLRTEHLREWINQHGKEITTLRRDSGALSKRIDDMAAQMHADLRAEVAGVEARSMQVSAAGLPGIALSILLTGIPTMLLAPGGWAWATFGLFVAVAIWHVAWTWRGALSAIAEGWRGIPVPVAAAPA